MTQAEWDKLLDYEPHNLTMRQMYGLWLHDEADDPRGAQVQFWMVKARKHPIRRWEVPNTYDLQWMWNEEIKGVGVTYGVPFRLPVEVGDRLLQSPSQGGGGVWSRVDTDRIWLYKSRIAAEGDLRQALVTLGWLRQQ